MKYYKIFLTALLAVIVLLAFSSCNACFHKYTDNVIPPNCTEEGKTVSTCEKCGATKEKDIVPALGHVLDETTYAPDCDSEGYTEFTCYCGFSYVVDIVAPTGHDYEDEVLPSTCEAVGKTVHTCKVCSFTSIDSYVSPSGHSLETLVTPPSCTEEGFTTYTCACGYSYRSDVTSPKGHTLSAEVTAPSCLSEGFTTFTCECGFSYKAEFTKPMGHAYEKAVTAPTCTEIGYTTYTCSACEHSFVTDETDPTGHTTTKSVLAPTCTEEGQTTYSCACGYTYSADVVAPLGHQFVKTVTAPTVSDMGYTEFTCQCGFSYTGDYRFYSEILDNAYAGSDKIVANGIDVSKWNHKTDSKGNFMPLDWQALKDAGVDYVILKVGSTLRDNGTAGGIEPTFEMDYEGAKAAGLDVGVYFFTYATTPSQIKKDAELLLTWLEGKQFEYPIYLDLEDVERESYYPSKIAPPILTEMCLTFFSTLQKEGYYTGLYVSNSFLYSVLQTENMIELFEIWDAHWPADNNYSWNVEKYGPHLGMWQYTDQGSFDAIPDMKFDLNYAYKDYPTLIKSHGFNGFSD